MKFSAACVVLAAVAAAAPAHANLIVDFTNTFFNLIKTQSIIKLVEKRNDEFLSPALSEITSELHQGLDSEIFKIGNGIHRALVDVHVRVGRIAGNATAVISQIQSVANTLSYLNFSDARLDYFIKRNRVKLLCNETLAKTTVALGLIDETIDLLGNQVKVPLKSLQTAIRSTSDDKVANENSNINYQQSIINAPPKVWLFFDDKDAIAAAEALKRQGQATVQRILILVENILEHIKWLEAQCIVIQEELDNERTAMSDIEGKISSASGNTLAITGGIDPFLDDQGNNDYVLRQGSQNLVKVMNQLKNEVINVVNARSRGTREARYGTGQAVQIAPENYSQADFLPESGTSSWLDKTSDNGCIYIYNRTTGCVLVKTFDAMKEQYTSLSDKFLKFDALYRAYDNGLEKLATQGFNVLKNITNPGEALKYVTDLRASKNVWSNDIKKIRDLSVSLNSYAESTFSEERTQLKEMQSNDSILNEEIMQYVDDNKKSAVNILNENLNDISVIFNQVADIISRLSINTTAANDMTNEDITVPKATISQTPGFYYYTNTEDQIVTGTNSPAVALRQPSWRDKTSDNSCIYIYSNRTTGCVFVETFNAMKEQYTLVSDNFEKFDTMYRAYDNGLETLTTQGLDFLKTATNQREANKFATVLDTNKFMWSADIKKIRDLCTGLNSYAESTFSDEKAQWMITQSNDDILNEQIMRYVDGNKKKSSAIINKCENYIFAIHNQVANILGRLSMKAAGTRPVPATKNGGYRQQNWSFANRATVSRY